MSAAPHFLLRPREATASVSCLWWCWCRNPIKGSRNHDDDAAEEFFVELPPPLMQFRCFSMYTLRSLTLLGFSTDSFGLTFSSPRTKYSLTMQKTAALRTIDCVSSADRARLGNTMSKWASVISEPWCSVTSSRILMAHKFVGNSPVAITGLTMLMDRSRGKDGAILGIIESISRKASLLCW